MHPKCRYIIFFLGLLLGPSFVFGQNLVPNPSFETYTSCPNGFGIPGTMNCAPWYNPNYASADYFNVCSNSPISDVPGNFQGGQFPATGDGYVGFWLKQGTPPGYFFEYASCPLLSTLIAGHAYEVSFYVSLAGKFCAIQHIGALFTSEELHLPNTEVIQATPQVESNMGWLNDTLNWMQVTGCFVAQGGEQYITIGNFRTYENTILESCPSQFTISTYYYLDDVSVLEMNVESLDVELGDDVTACYQYTIVPDAPPNANYLWSNGSSDPTITVTTSGLYKLTVNIGCAIGEDSIMVEIVDSPDVEINPEEITICQGDHFDINLDPDAGEYEWNDGSNSSSYSITSSGMYAVTLNDGCDLTTDEINVTVLDPPPPISLGNDTILCQNTGILYTLDPGLGVYTWQNGSHNSFFNVLQGGDYSVTLSNLCGESEASVSVDELDPYEVNLGPDRDTLCVNDFIDIFLEHEYTTFLWQDGSNESQYHIDAPGIYSVTATHVCGESEDQIVITQLAPPAIDLGNDLHGCPGDEFELLANAESANYIWQDGTTGNSFLITGPGTYTVAVQNACGIDYDTVVASYDELIVPPSLGPDLSLCPGEQIILQAGHQHASYQWQDGSTADTLVVNATGSYAVTVSNGCFSYSDTINLLVQNLPPVIDLPDHLVLCEGSSTTLDPQVNGVTFAWNDGSSDSTLLVSTSGIYSLTVSNACGSNIDSVIIQNGGAIPLLNLGVDTSICPGHPFLLQPTSTHVDTWLWHDGSASPFLMVADSGYFYVSGSNYCGVTTDTIHISLLESIPVFTLGSDTSVCPGAIVNLGDLPSNVDIQWNDGTNNPTLSVNTPGMYSVTISNACGINADTIVVTELPDVPILNLGVDQSLCPGETITIDPGINNVNYLWQDGSTGPTFTADHDQTVILSIANICGISTDSLLIFTNSDGPDVELGTDVLACAGEMVTIHSNILGVTYLWQDGSTGPDFVTSTSGTYSVVVSNLCGIDSDSINVDIHGTPPVAALSADTLLCEGHSILLFANTDAETSIIWQDGSSTNDYQVNQPGLYTLHLSNRCGDSSDSIQVNYQATPSPFELGPDQILCVDDTLELSAPTTNDEITWQDGSHAPVYIVDHTGMYALTISNQCAEVHDAINIEYENDIVEWPVVDTLHVCPGNLEILDVTQLFDASYEWSDGSSSSKLEVTKPGNYIVTITTSCFSTSKKFTILEKTNCLTKHDIFIPNIFSPNGDNVNDVFVIGISDGVKVTAEEGRIYDRWGDVIYSSTEIPFTWNGRFKNQKVLPGVYVYLLEITYEFNSQVHYERLTGDITIIQ